MENFITLHDKTLSISNNLTENGSRLLKRSAIETVSSESYAVIAFFMSVIFVLGLVENSFSLFVFFRTRSLRTTNNIFIAGLVLSDWSQSVFGVPFVVVSSLVRKWIFGHSLCVYYSFVTTFLGITQITTLTAISLDKYLVIVKRAQHFIIVDKKHAIFVIFLCYLHGFLWALFPAIGWSSYQLEGANVSCSVRWQSNETNDVAYSLSLMLFGWIIPLGAIVYSYSAICLLLRREAKKPVRRNLKALQKKKQMNREKSVAITVLIMIGAFVISWMPYSIVSLMAVFGDPDEIPQTVTMVPAIFAKSSIIWNPIIYVARHNDFRRACLKNLPACGVLKKLGRPRGSMSSVTSRRTSEYLLRSNQKQKSYQFRLLKHRTSVLTSTDIVSSPPVASKNDFRDKSRDTKLHQSQSDSPNTDADARVDALDSIETYRFADMHNETFSVRAAKIVTRSVTKLTEQQDTAYDISCQIYRFADMHNETFSDIIEEPDISAESKVQNDDESSIEQKNDLYTEASLDNKETPQSHVAVQTSLDDNNSTNDQRRFGKQADSEPRMVFVKPMENCDDASPAQNQSQMDITNEEQLLQNIVAGCFHTNKV